MLPVLVPEVPGVDAGDDDTWRHGTITLSAMCVGHDIQLRGLGVKVNGLIEQDVLKHELPPKI